MEGETACHCYNDSFRPPLLHAGDNRLSLINLPSCLKENKYVMSWTLLDCHPADAFIQSDTVSAQRHNGQTFTFGECLNSHSFCQ